jgi:Glycosyltransferase
VARVCVVRCHFYRDSRVQREVVALVDHGHDVRVVCLRDHREPRREQHVGLSIHRLPLRHVAGAGPARLIAEYLAFFLLGTVVVSALHMRSRFDVVQVNSVPDALVFIALIPRLTGARVLLDLQEPMPEFFAAKFGVGNSHPVVRLLIALEQLSIRFADASMTATDAMRRTFINRGAPADRITVVMDGSDESVFAADRVTGRPDPDCFVIVSHGTIEPQYGLDTAIEAIALLAPQFLELRLKIIGDGSERENLLALTANLHITDRVWFSDGFLPIGELVETLATADVGLVAMKRDRFRDLTLAGKMFDFIAMGIPMIVSRTRSVEETFGDGCFEVFESGVPDDLAEAIRRLHAEPALRKELAARASAVAETFAWPVQRQRYRELVASLTTTGSEVRR